MAEKFKYTYSACTAEERKEIDAIRRQYDAQAATDALTRLRSLDRRVKVLSKGVGCAVGLIGCLLFGLGLSMVLTWELWLWGSIVAVLGAVPMAAAYPCFRAVLRYGKHKYGDEIVRLSDELLAEDGALTKS